MKALIYAVAILTISIITYASLNASLPLEETGPQLADSINGKSIHTLEVVEYLANHNNFSDLPFKKVNTETIESLKVNYANENTKGYEKYNKRFVIDLVGCDYKSKRCNFRINGIHVNNLRKNEPFSMGDELSINVKSIAFGKCDTGMCHPTFETYDEVLLVIK